MTTPGTNDRALLDMMAKGLGYAEIAAALDTTQESVDRQVTELFSRMAGDGGSSGLVDEFKRLHSAVVEQTASRKTLASFVPSQLADRLAAQPDSPIEPQECEVTVLFSDIRGFSTLAERLGAREVATVVGKHLSAMAEVVAATAARSTSSRATRSWRSSARPTPSPTTPSGRSCARSRCRRARAS